MWYLQPKLCPITSKHKISITATQAEDLKWLEDHILKDFNIESLTTRNIVVSNLKHHQQQILNKESLETVFEGIDSSITNDFDAQDIRLSLYHLGEITREISMHEIPSGVYHTFCIERNTILLYYIINCIFREEFTLPCRLNKHHCIYSIGRFNLT